MSGAPRPVSKAAPARKPAKRASFENHSLYRQLSLQRSFAQLSDIANPYYGVHAVKAGATTVLGGRELVNFASYDYLGLNGHPDVVAAAEAALREFGTSVSASRITAGERSVHGALERALADHYGAQEAIAFVSGHAAAVSTLATLLGPKDLIAFDALSHNCLTVGAKLSGATRRAFPHNDFDALDDMLERERDRFERVMIVTEGLFSMDGDTPDLARLFDIKTRHDAVLMVDDAHGFGVLGARGFGVFEEQGIDPAEIDLWFGTLSKTLASCGGYVAGSSAAIEILKFYAPGLVYSVGMPAPAAAAAAMSLDVMLREPERVARLHANSRLFHRRARSLGLDVGPSVGLGIIPVMVGDTLRTLRLSERLIERGFYAFPILPPGVPDGAARLRFFFTEAHEPAQIEGAVDAVGEILSELPPASARGGPAQDARR